MSQTYSQASVFAKGSDVKVAKNVFIPADDRTAPLFDGTASAAITVQSRPVHQVSLHLSNSGTFDTGFHDVNIGGGSYYLQSAELFKYGAGAADAEVIVGLSSSVGAVSLVSFNLSGTTNGQWVAPSIDTGSWGTVAYGAKGDKFIVVQQAPSGSAGAFINLTFGLG